MKGNGRRGRKGKEEGRRQVEGFGPPKNFGVPPYVSNNYHKTPQSSGGVHGQTCVHT